MEWDSIQYLKFEKQRTQPALDLISRIPLTKPNNILDVGCGPGNSTASLQGHFPIADIVGIDNSQNMIDMARAAYPSIPFKQLDAEDGLPFLGKAFDIVFSNACIQWIPDHHALLPKMLSIVSNEGVLAVQIPMQKEMPIHQIISRIVHGEPWSKKIEKKRIFYTLSPEEYFDILASLSCTFDIWQTTYYHPMKNHEDIIEWYRGSGLRPYLASLSEEEGKALETDLLKELRKSYPRQANGTVILKFPRLFFVVTKDCL